MKIPEKYRNIIALLKFDDVPPIAAVGFVAETTDTKEPYFHIPLDRAGYDISLIVKWDYLDEVAPEYCGVIEEVKE